MTKIQEAIEKNKDLTKEHIETFMRLADDAYKARFVEAIKKDDHDSAFSTIREFLVRQVVANRLKEVVRKKPGGGYVLYSPAKGKKKGKPAGTYPTAAAAKKAQFNKFPPKDPEAKKRAKDAIAKAEKKKKPAAKKESLEIMALRVAIRKMMVESLFREEKAGSEWDDYVSRLPKQVFSNDRKLANLQKGIEKKVEGALEDALAHIAKAVGKKVKIKNHGIKKNESGKTYISFGATVDEVSVDPIYVYIQSGVPKLEVSDNARASLTKIEPQTSKLFRADLVQVQERVLDHMDELARAIEARDKYLMKIEAEVDKYVADLSGLELTLLKRLLTQKYRKN